MIHNKVPERPSAALTGGAAASRAAPGPTIAPGTWRGEEQRGRERQREVKRCLSARPRGPAAHVRVSFLTSR